MDIISKCDTPPPRKVFSFDKLDSFFLLSVKLALIVNFPNCTGEDGEAREEEHVTRSKECSFQNWNCFLQRVPGIESHFWSNRLLLDSRVSIEWGDNFVTIAYKCAISPPLSWKGDQNTRREGSKFRKLHGPSRTGRWKRQKPRYPRSIAKVSWTLPRMN